MVTYKTTVTNNRVMSKYMLLWRSLIKSMIEKYDSDVFCYISVDELTEVNHTAHFAPLRFAPGHT